MNELRDPLADFAAAVRAALEGGREMQLDGPRTVSDLARALGLRRSTLHRYLTGARAMPADVEAAIRAALPEIPNDQ